MNLFKNLLGSSETPQNTSKMEWNMLADLGQLHEIIDLSHNKAVVIFKHSTRCSISRFALKQFENEFKLEDVVAPYFLDLLAHRMISNEVATRFDVAHQSPQILLIKDGKAIYNASHSDIDAQNLMEFI
jgi:bacillithiol system protein YtxJ